jgi:sporulation protein YlmC with PRC-barrel domain
MMLKAIENLYHCRIIASDGQVGTVRDVYFDDERWVVRYLVVETGSWLHARRVLISPYAVRFIDWQTRAIVVNLTRDQVRHSPGIDTDKPVSRQQEDEFHRYYGYPQYWPYATLWAWGEIPIILPPTSELPIHQDGAGADVHLRSSKVVIGYRIHATDAFHGRVADFLIDEETWAIRYLIADTRLWLPGKHVLVARESIGEVSWAEQTVGVALTRREFEKLPAYDRRHPPSSDDAKARVARPL